MYYWVDDSPSWFRSGDGGIEELRTPQPSPDHFPSDSDYSYITLSDEEYAEMMKVEAAYIKMQLRLDELCTAAFEQYNFKRLMKETESRKIREKAEYERLKKIYG